MLQFLLSYLLTTVLYTVAGMMGYHTYHATHSMLLGVLVAFATPFIVRACFWTLLFSIWWGVRRLGKATAKLRRRQR